MTREHPKVTLPGRVKGYAIAYSRQVLYRAAFSGVFPEIWSARLISRFWEDTAEDINSRYGQEKTDFDVLTELLNRYEPQSLLDLGCGSGRLFPVYHACEIPNVTGMDVSERALELARSKMPMARLLHVRLEDLDLGEGVFDFCVCNRVLQHLPDRHIDGVVQTLSKVCKIIYVNELTKSDGLEEAFFMHEYDYPNLFGAQGLTALESGQIGRQTYTVFGRST